jgi:hypothetical protein
MAQDFANKVLTAANVCRQINVTPIFVEKLKDKVRLFAMGVSRLLSSGKT